RAPARGATRGGGSRQGGRRVSIRAPARGATLFVALPGPTSMFRSALPRGERHAFPAASDRSYSFRSALPRGERPLGAGTEPAAVEFRSALPRGERLGMLWIATIVSGF